MPVHVILDRDGVVNEDSPHYIKTPDEWLPIEGSLEAIARLCDAGIDVYIATNQAGIARGKLTLAALDDIHRKLLNAVRESNGEIRAIRYCPHHPDDNCDCRKPKPGMINSLASEFGLDMENVYYVGDSLKDLRAAEAAGCTGVLVLTGNGEETLHLRPDHEPVFANLLEFANYLIDQFV